MGSVVPLPVKCCSRAVTGHLSLIPYTGQRCRDRNVRVAAILAFLTPAIGMRWVGVRDVAVRPRRDGSLSYYARWLRRGRLNPSPLQRERKGRSAPIRSQLHVHVHPPPSLSPCSPTGKGGEEDTRVRLESSLFVSSPNTGPSEGEGAEWGRGAGEEAAREDGVMALGIVGLPEWRLGGLLRSA